MVLPAGLQPLQDPEGLLTRAQDLSVTLPGMLTPKLASQLALFEGPSSRHAILLLKDAIQLSTSVALRNRRGCWT